MHSSVVRRGAICLARFGVSYYEIGDALGVCNSTVSSWARSAGIVRGKGGGCVARNNAKRNEEAKARIEDMLGGKFKVLNLEPNRWATLKCVKCDSVFRRNVDPRYPTECPGCKKREVERHEEECKLALTRRAIIRALHGVLRFKEMEERKAQFLDATHVCKECGKTFTMRELRESNPWNYSYNPTFCSRSCRKRFHKRESRHRRRELGEQRHCGSVSLHELEMRDHNTCYLCGCTTNRSDYSVDENGNFTAGPTYPSIDHVVPLSKGGAHDMDNVKLACCRCNAIKRDQDVDEALRDISNRSKGWL